MRTAYQVITVGAKSSAECAASGTSASEPESTPTTALAIVRPPEAAIEVSATRSLFSCISALQSGGGRARSFGHLARRLAHRLAVLVDQPGAQLRRARHIVDAADALAGRPHALPGALFVVEIELLGRRPQVDVSRARGLDAWPQEIAVHAADRRGVDDIIRVGRDDHVLEFRHRHAFARRDEARAEVGEVGAEHARGRD